MKKAASSDREAQSGNVRKIWNREAGKQLGRPLVIWEIKGRKANTRKVTYPGAGDEKDVWG